MKIYEIRFWKPYTLSDDNDAQSTFDLVDDVAYFYDKRAAFDYFKKVWEKHPHPSNIFLVEACRRIYIPHNNDKEYQLSVDYNNNNMIYLRWIWDETVSKIVPEGDLRI